MDNFPEEDKRWYMRVGYLAENWAAVELQLDMIVRTFYLGYGGDKIESSVPQALNRKLRFARKILAEHPELGARVPTIGEMFDEIQRLANIRHWAIHGNRVGTEGDLAELSRFVHGADPRAMERTEISLDEVFEAACDCASLAAKLVFLMPLAYGLRTQEETERLVDEFASQIEAAFQSDDPAG